MKLKTMTKVICALLSLMLLLSACSPASETSSTQTASKSKETSSSDTGTSGVSGEARSLSVEIFDRGNSPSGATATENPVTEWIKEKVKEDLNMDVTFVAVPKSEEVDKLNVMMAGGTAPDISFTYKENVIANFAKQGGLTDLGDLIAQYGSNIEENLGDLLSYGVMYDKQFAIPSRRVDEVDKFFTYMNTTLLEKYNLEVPATTEAFYDAMTVIHEKEPDVVPYAMTDPTQNVRFYSDVITSFIKYADDRENAIYNSDTTRLAAPGTKEGYRTMNQWYHEGLVSQDFALDTQSTQWKADISNGKVLAFTGHQREAFDSGLIQAAYAANGSVFIPVNIFTDYKDEYNKELYNIGIYSCVPAASSNAQAAVEYLNWLSNPEIYNQIRSGEIIGAATKAENGIYSSYTGDDYSEKFGVSANIPSDATVMVKNDIAYEDAALYQEKWITTYSAEEFDIAPVIESYYASSQPKGSYFAPRLGAPTDGEAAYGANVKSAIQSMCARLIVCDPAEFDALWDQEIESISVAGMNQILEERGALYDASNS